jgi:Spy/CpxP family protein refolding chaperone
MASADPSMLRVRVVTALVIAGVFVSGAVVGAGIYRWGSSAGPAEGLPHGQGAGLWLPLEGLDLTPEQDAKVSAIMDQRRGELESIVRQTFPQVRAINEQMQQEVRAILTPEQQRRWDEQKLRRPSGPTPTWQKSLDDESGVPLAPRRTPNAPPPSP